ncbi:phage tail protein, partial [Escherichia coli]|nr:phage tail protein [Escherichia coli]
MKTFRWKVKPGMDVASAPSVRKVRFGDGYSQRAPAGLNADLKTYSVTLSVPRWEATVNRPGFPGECFICELRLPDHRFRWKHNKLFLLL